MSIIERTSLNDYSKIYGIYSIFFDCSWSLDACLKHHFVQTINRKNRQITRFLNKHFHRGNANFSEKVLDDNETIMAYESYLDRVFCRIDTPYKEELQAKYNVYRYNINGKDMVSYFVTIYTSINEDKSHSEQCALQVEHEDVDLERALILLPTFREQFTRNQTI